LPSASPWGVRGRRGYIWWLQTVLGRHSPKAKWRQLHLTAFWPHHGLVPCHIGSQLYPLLCMWFFKIEIQFTHIVKFPF
jgi:hypothetical protein